MTSKAEEDRLLEKYSNYAAKIAINIYNSRGPGTIQVDDAISVALEGLWKAARKYDKANNKGASFKTYAKYRIQGAVLDLYRSPYAEYSRKDKCKKFNMASIDALEDDPDSTFCVYYKDYNLGDLECREFFDSVIEKYVTGTNKIVLQLMEDGYTVQDIAKILKITTSRVHQIKDYILCKYRAAKTRAEGRTWRDFRK